MKGYFDLPTLIGFVMGIIVYIVAIYPILNSFIVSANVDSTTASILTLVPAALLIAMLISVFQYAFGSRKTITG